MKKIYLHTGVWYLFGYSIFPFLYMLLFFIIYFIFNFKLTNKDFGIIALITLPLCLVFVFPYLTYLLIKKKSYCLIINQNNIVYDKKNIKDIILIKDIKELIYKYDELNGLYNLSIILNDNNNYQINMSKSKIKKLAKYINKTLIYDSLTRSQYIKNNILSRRQEIKKFIKNNKKKNFVSLIDLIITIFSFVLYYILKKNFYISLILSLFSISYCILQLYFLYFVDKEYGKFGRIFLSILSTLMINILFLLVILLLFVFLKIEFDIVNVLIYSIFLLPSFIEVFAIIILLMTCLGYV